MDYWVLLLSISLFSGFFSLSSKILAQTPSQEVPQETIQDANTAVNISKYLRGISIKVSSQNGRGSGFLVQKQGAQYWVVTNYHVVLDEKADYQVTTWDDIVHQARIVSEIDYGDYDLRLLEFTVNDEVYETAVLGDIATVDVRTFPRVIAAGFPDQAQQGETVTENFQTIAGILTYRLVNSIDGGYSMGYTNPILKGMSGGPLINQQGEVIAVNGLHAYPLWDVDYIDDAGNPVPLSLYPVIKNHSWGIPINVVQHLLNQLASQND